MLPLLGSVPPYQHDRPDSVQILISRVLITNNHVTLCSKKSSIDAHRALLHKCQALSLCSSRDFPNSHLPEKDLELVAAEHFHYATSDRLSYAVDTGDAVEEQSAYEVMSIELEQFWMEFTGVGNAGSRPVSFLESFPITVWLTLPPEMAAGVEEQQLGHQSLERLTELTKSKQQPSQLISSHKHTGVMIDIGGKICAQLNHYQYCFLMRLADSFSDMADAMAKEAKLHKELARIQNGSTDFLPKLGSSSGTISFLIALESVFSTRIF